MCILIEGCTAPLSLAGRPAGVSEEDWTQWGRHLKRLTGRPTPCKRSLRQWLLSRARVPESRVDDLLRVLAAEWVTATCE